MPVNKNLIGLGLMLERWPRRQNCRPGSWGRSAVRDQGLTAAVLPFCFPGPSLGHPGGGDRVPTWLGNWRWGHSEIQVVAVEGDEAGISRPQGAGCAEQRVSALAGGNTACMTTALGPWPF